MKSFHPNSKYNTRFRLGCNSNQKASNSIATTNLKTPKTKIKIPKEQQQQLPIVQPNLYHKDDKVGNTHIKRNNYNRRAIFMAWSNAFFIVSSSNIFLPVSLNHHHTFPNYNMIHPPSANAACLQGDTSVDCIGVYKLPLDDEIIPFINTPESLEKYAPDVRFVPPVPMPQSLQKAMEDLTQCQYSIQGSIRTLILKGDLLTAGTQLLDIIPRVAVDGKFILMTLDDNNNGKKEKKVYQEEQFQLALNQVLYNMNQVDIMLGQALRGDLGALTPAQIQILSTLKDVEASFQDMMDLLVVSTMIP